MLAVINAVLVIYSLGEVKARVVAYVLLVLVFDLNYVQLHGCRAEIADVAYPNIFESAARSSDRTIGPPVAKVSFFIPSLRVTRLLWLPVGGLCPIAPTQTADALDDIAATIGAPVAATPRDPTANRSTLPI